MTMYTVNFTFTEDPWINGPTYNNKGINEFTLSEALVFLKECEEEEVLYASRQR